MNALVWIPLADRLPPDEQFVLLAGDSGYTTTPNFVVLGRRYMSYRPTLADGKVRWLDPTETPLADNGWEPTHWAECPLLPGAKALIAYADDGIAGDEDGWG